MQQVRFPNMGCHPVGAPIRQDHLGAWGEEGVAASESDKEVEHRRVFLTKHLSIVAIRHPPALVCAADTRIGQTPVGAEVRVHDPLTKGTSVTILLLLPCSSSSSSLLPPPR